jgi:spore germination protein YaaH
MNRTSLTLLAALGGALALSAPAQAASRCATTRPVAVKAKANAAGTRLTVTWRRPRHAASGLAYRVSRNGKVVGQTRGHGLHVRASAGTRPKIVVAAVVRGHLTRCSVTLRPRIATKAPGRVTALAARPQSGNAVLLTWKAAKRGARKIAAYRVLRDGKTVRQVKGRSLTVTVATNHRYRYQVAAVDTAGRVGRASKAVTVLLGHQAPGAPGAPQPVSVSDTSVTLNWAPAALPAGSQLRGYRILRNGAVVSQVSSATATIKNLAAKKTYGWSVAAVDTLGYVSAPSAVTSVLQADPPATTGNAYAFLLASTDASYADFRAHYRQIGTVSPTFWDCNTGTGAIEGRNDAGIVAWAQDRKVKVLPRFNCQNTAILSRILNDASLRASWLDAIVNTADQYGYDGVNVDFEAVAAADRDALTSFIAALAGRLHAQGKLLSQAVSAKSEDVANHPRSTAFDYNALSQYDDTIFVMAWGIHWATSDPGAQDDYSWVKQIDDYVASLPRKSKYVMGTMLYGMDWPNGGGTANPGAGRYYDDIAAIAAQYGATPVLDPTTDSYRLNYTDSAGTPHEIWYSDANAVADRFKLARDRGLGIGFWRLGQEDARVWSNPLVGGTP